MKPISNTVYKVPHGWHVYTVDQIKANEPHSCVAGPFGSKISAKFFVDAGVPVIRGSNLRDDLTRFVPKGFVFVSEDRAREYAAQHVSANDLVFTCWGTIGQVGIIPDDGPFEQYIISNKQLKLRINEELANPLFCFYYFASPRYVEHVRGRSIGGAIPGINLGILKSLRIALPTRLAQDRVVAVLSAYDELIENNLRRIALLEEAMRLLHLEWFAHFRFPGHEHVKIVDGIPEGWDRCPIGNILELKYGKALKASDRRDGAVPVYGSSGVVGTHHAAMVEGPSIVVGRKGNVGSLYWVPVNFWPIDTVYYIPREQVDYWLYLSLPFAGFQNTDAGVPGLNRDFAYSRKLVRPTHRVRRLFNETVEPMFLQRTNLENYNRKLSQARDLLLPRLINGDIAV